jgi:hypothetical protein
LAGGEADWHLAAAVLLSTGGPRGVKEKEASSAGRRNGISGATTLTNIAVQSNILLLFFSYHTIIFFSIGITSRLL